MVELIANIQYNESQDRFLRSKWYRGVTIANVTTRFVSAADDRVALNMFVIGVASGTLLLFGGPTGSNGSIILNADLATRGDFFQFNIDTEPNLCKSEAWIEGFFQGADVIVTEVFCCER